MAAKSRSILHLRRDLYTVVQLHRNSSHRHLSSSSDTPPIAPQTDYKDVKDSLRSETPPRNRPQPQSSRFSFRKGQASSPEATSLEEIRKNLSKYRGLTAAPPPSSSDLPTEPITFQDLYEKVVDSTVNNPNDAAKRTSAGAASGIRLSFDTVRQSLRSLKASSNPQMGKSESGGKIGDRTSLGRFMENWKLKGGEMNAEGLGMNKMRNFGRDNAGAAAAAGMRLDFGIAYSHQDLGKKLAALRPEKKKGKWFSLQEFSDRLAKVKEMEAKERKARTLGLLSTESFTSLERTDENKKTVQHVHILSHLGGTPEYMLSPPQDHLTQKYFHPDHMSSAEKLKLELKKVRDEFKMSESDCGSARVQVAQLTTKIKHLSSVLLKKDKHSRKGLQDMVQRRKKLLKYLRRSDWDSYTLVLSKLGLRDNPDSKLALR